MKNVLLILAILFGMIALSINYDVNTSISVLTGAGCACLSVVCGYMYRIVNRR